MDTNFLLIMLLMALGFLLLFLVFVMRNLGGVLPYLYVTARIRAKEARLIDNNALDEMMDTGSIAEIGSMLENSDYALAMQGLVLDSARSIEEMLTRQTAEVYSEVAGMLPAKVRPVFRYLLQQWDVYNLKSILRGVRAGRPWEKILAAVVDFGELDPDQLKRMSEAQGIEDLLPMFDGTPYAGLAAMLPAYEQSKNLLPLEAALDKQLFEGVWRIVASDRRFADLRSFFAARIDALNLKMLFRAKNDRVAFSDVENFFIDGGDISAEFYGRMDDVEGVGAFVPELESTVFHRPLIEAMPEFERGGSLYGLEKVLDETALAVGRNASIKQPYGIAPVLGYLCLKETEIRNIRAIAFAKEARMMPEKIREFVLRV